jgi:hypothetical protein
VWYGEHGDSGAEMTVMVKTAFQKKQFSFVRFVTPFVVVVMLALAGLSPSLCLSPSLSSMVFLTSLGFSGLKYFRYSSTSTVKVVRALTWNIAAINNNPFGHLFSLLRLSSHLRILDHQ